MRANPAKYNAVESFLTYVYTYHIKYCTIALCHSAEMGIVGFNSI